MKEYCCNCFNSGWDFDPQMGWVGCHCGRCEGENGEEVIKPTFGTWLHFLVKTAVVDALKEIFEAQKARREVP